MKKQSAPSPWALIRGGRIHTEPRDTCAASGVPSACRTPTLGADTPDVDVTGHVRVSVEIQKKPTSLEARS